MALNVRLPASITIEAILPDCPDFDRPISRSDRAEGLPVPGCRLEKLPTGAGAHSTPSLQRSLCSIRTGGARQATRRLEPPHFGCPGPYFGACSRRVDHVNSEAFLRRSPSLRATIDA
jgi:hypothetical protein